MFKEDHNNYIQAWKTSPIELYEKGNENYLYYAWRLDRKSDGVYTLWNMAERCRLYIHGYGE
jgi:hypothetical protein